MHLFDILPAILSRKVGIFFCLGSGNLVSLNSMCLSGLFQIVVRKEYLAKSVFKFGLEGHLTSKLLPCVWFSRAEFRGPPTNR